MQGVQRAAGEALAAEAARLSAHFEALQARIEEAKSQAAAACQPMPREAKVANTLTHDSPWPTATCVPMRFKSAGLMHHSMVQRSPCERGTIELVNHLSQVKASTGDGCAGFCQGTCAAECE